MEDDHELFTKYLPKIRAFCHEKWPSVTKDFVITHIEGGRKNLIVGITIQTIVNSKWNSCILKIPRNKGDEQQPGMPLLYYVQTNIFLPVPDTIFLDPTDNNLLGCPYIVQTQIPGRRLCDVYTSLSHEQQKVIAKEFGKLLLNLQNTKEKKSGVIHGFADKQRFRIDPFPVDPEPKLDLGNLSISDEVSVGDTYSTLFRLQEASVRQHFPEQKAKADYFHSLRLLAQEMDDGGLFQHATHCLCLHDLTARKVMVDVHKDGPVKTTGILGWENAVIAPCFTACKLPGWLWGEEEPTKAFDILITGENQELKDIFEKTVGDEFIRYCCNPKYQLATQLFDLARHGSKIEESLLSEEAEKLLKAWAKLRPAFLIE